MTRQNQAPTWRDLDILYEDNHLLAVSKPANLLVQGDRTGDVTLLDLARASLKERHAKPGQVYLGLVHRLDRPVTGVVLLARTSKAAGRLSRQFRESTVRKTYLAIVEGTPPAGAAELNHFLAAAGDARGVTRAEAAPFPGSRPARLRYHVTGQTPQRARLEVELLTGRRHQIRAQLALAGCPVLGDVKYGARRQPALRGIALHAWRLEVEHPVGGAPLRLEAPVPPDWPWQDSQP
jgi:23S rRNA pseudouridine1911/1915/1917 synthase